MPRLKVMTLNIWGYRGEWLTRRNRLINALQEEEIDVLLLQEAEERMWRPNQAMEIAQLTGYAMVFMPAQRFFPWTTLSTGLAILSRFPISNPIASEITAPSGVFSAVSNERRIAQRVEISLDGMSVVIYNTHFPLNETAREVAAYRLWTQVVQEEAVLVVVGGDFNARPQERAIGFLQGKEVIERMHGELTDVWSHAGVGPGETFPAGAPTARIDYIFYQAEPTVIVQEAKVIGMNPREMSDHAALVATFSISPSRDPGGQFVEEPIGSLEPTGGGGGWREY